MVPRGILAAVWDQSPDPKTQTHARRSPERSLALLPELSAELRLEAMVTLHSFWDA